MPAPPQLAPIASQSGTLQSVDVDLLVFPWFEGEASSSFEALDQAPAGEVSRPLQSGEFTGKPFEFFITPIVELAFSSDTWK